LMINKRHEGSNQLTLWGFLPESLPMSFISLSF
jgi:hypothetical protein